MAVKMKTGSRVLAVVQETARDLHEAGAIDKERMAQFDALCVGPAPEFSGRKIRALRRRHGISQEVLASALNTSVATIRQWENDERRPRGAALRLLDLLDRKGLAVLVSD